MKKLILILTIASASIGYAQKISSSDVPVAVTSQLTALYPSGNVEQWKKEKGNYEVKFTQNSTKMCLVMDAKGNVVKTTTTVAVSDLPNSANDYIIKNYTNEKVTEASKTVEANGVVKYEAKVKETHLCFDTNGNFIKSEKRKS